MNQNQLNSLVRTILKIAGTALAAHGLTVSANLVNSEDVFGLVVLLVGLLQSHQTHGAPASGPGSCPSPIAPCLEAGAPVLAEVTAKAALPSLFSAGGGGQPNVGRAPAATPPPATTPLVTLVTFRQDQ